MPIYGSINNLLLSKKISLFNNITFSCLCIICNYCINTTKCSVHKEENVINSFNFGETFQEQCSHNHKQMLFGLV